MITEWTYAEPDDSKYLFRNRLSMLNKNEIQVISEGQGNDGKLERIGILKGKRIP